MGIIEDILSNYDYNYLDNWENFKKGGYLLSVGDGISRQEVFKFKNKYYLRYQSNDRDFGCEVEDVEDLISLFFKKYVNIEEFDISFKIEEFDNFLEKGYQISFNFNSKPYNYLSFDKIINKENNKNLYDDKDFLFDLAECAIDYDLII
jgi:hypothetical protein